MSDKEARVLGAGDFLEVNGKEYHLRPIAMQQLHEVQRAAVVYYKREYLRTFAENADLLPPDHAASLLERKFEEVAKWDIGHLPAKIAYDVRLVNLTAQINVWLENEYGDLPDSDNTKRAMLAAALDSGKITADEVQQKTGTKPGRVQIPYDSWWVTAVYDGMVTFIWASLRSGDAAADKGEVSRWPLSKIMEASRLVEKLTAPALGNT